MLSYIGQQNCADLMENAISEVIKEGVNVTYDMKPSPDDPSAVGTSNMADAIIEKIMAARK
jgi:isocitrate dehydrogenase (NAD+)